MEAERVLYLGKVDSTDQNWRGTSTECCPIPLSPRDDQWKEERIVQSVNKDSLRRGRSAAPPARKISCVHPFSPPWKRKSTQKKVVQSWLCCHMPCFCLPKKAEKTFQADAVWSSWQFGTSSFEQIHKIGTPKITGFIFRVQLFHWIPVVLRKDSEESSHSAQYPSLPKRNWLASAKKLARA